MKKMKNIARDKDLSKKEMEGVKGGLVAFNFAVEQQKTPGGEKIGPAGLEKTPGGEKI